MEDVLETSTLGGFTVKRNDASITEFATRKARALFIYLAYTGQPHAREFLAELLWEERSQEQALGNLRVALHNLRQHLAPYLVITPQIIGFDTDSKYWLDALELNKGLDTISKQGSQRLSRATAGRLEDTLALYKGEFLAGFYLRDSTTFEEWLTLERELLRQRVIEAYHGLI